MRNPKDYIDAEIASFEKEPETARAESTLRELIAIYRENTKIEHVLTKVITINALYHARVLDVDLHPLAVHISKIQDLDAKLKQGNSDAVDAIWQSQGTKKHYFSFATKFCSWHNQEAYAIYDLNMWEALRAYKSKELRFQFKDSECKDYASFHAIVKRFEAAYDLEGYSLKDVDKFLWLVGERLLKAKKENAS
jgi:hypothetical protein